MLTCKERWLLTGAWAAVLACSVGGVLIVRARTEAASAAVASFRPGPEVAWCGPRVNGNRTMEKFFKSQEVLSSVRVPSTPYVGCMVPDIKEVTTPPKPGEELLLPSALYSGKFGMDRVTLNWTLREPKLDPKAKRKQKRSAPQAFVIRRQCEGGEIDKEVVLDGKVTAFEDLDIQPNRSYRYWVLLRGEEGPVDQKTGHAPVVEKESEGAAEGAAPAWHKVKVLGGDRQHAILSVESYDPKTGKWDTRRVMASPGQAIGATGWTLEGIRFDKFTLVAEVRDDRSEKREISTKKE